MKRLNLGLAAVGLALAAAAAWWLQNRPAAPSATPAAAVAPRPAAVGPETASAAPLASSRPGGPGGQGGAAGAGGPSGGGGPAPVEVGRAQAMKLDDDAQAVGALQARQGVVIRPEVSGRVAKVGFKDGQQVKRGQLLLQFDDTLQRAQLRQADAQASIARTNLQRQRELVAQNFVSQSAVDQSAAALEVAEAQVALARAQLARMRVLAPFDGQLGITSIDPGDFVREGTDIVAIDDISSMTVDFRLPERYAARVQKGQLVQVSVDAVPGQAFSGVVQATDVQVDANGRSLLVRATIDNAKRNLRTGMFARTRIVFATREKAIVVPEEALVPLAGKQFVIRVIDGEQGKVSQRLEAKVGVRLNGKAEILEGLSAGDAVVTAGHARLLARDGIPVRVVDVDRPAAASATPGTRPSL